MLMESPFISIIIPTLNEERYIESTLKALRNQDYDGHYEIIVADGMSKDNTAEIAGKYADTVIKVNREGVSAGRNEGAYNAKGDILLFIDADVIAFPNALSEIVHTFQEEDAVGFGCQLLPLSNKYRDRIIYGLATEFAKITVKLGYAQIGGLFSSYRKDIFYKLGGFNEELFTCEDYDLSRKVSKYGKVVFMAHALGYVSTRRVESWGMTRSTLKYLHIYLKYLLSRRSVGLDNYQPIR